MAKVKILSIGRPSETSHVLSSFEEQVEWTFIAQTNRLDTIENIKASVRSEGPFEVVMFFLTFSKSAETGLPFPSQQEMFEPLVEGGKLKVVIAPGAGFEHVDTDYLTRNGVFYANGPETVGKRTADSTLMLIMQALRGSSEHEHNLREGKWLDRSIVSKDSRECTIGIIGMGRIGQYVAKGAESWLGMKVVYTKRSRLPASEEGKFKYLSLDELLATSDLISLNCPLTAETHHLITAKEFAKMKDGVIIVNTARGAVIDENALVEALDSGKVLRAALDVFENEPAIHPGLLKNHKCILTPHSACLNETIQRDHELEMFENLKHYLKTGAPFTPVNKPLRS